MRLQGLPFPWLAYEGEMEAEKQERPRLLGRKGLKSKQTLLGNISCTVNQELWRRCKEKPAETVHRAS